MKSFETVEMENVLYLIYELEEQECVDHIVLGMLDNNVIPGIMPMQFMQIDNRKIVRYIPSYTKSLEEMLAQPLLREQILSIIKNISRTLLQIRDYMISVNQLCMDCSHIYVNQEGNIELICLPVEPKELYSDYKAHIIELLKQWNEKYFYVQGSIYWELCRLLEKPNQTLENFIYEIEKKELELLILPDENSNYSQLILNDTERVQRKNPDESQNAEEPVILSRQREENPVEISRWNAEVQIVSEKQESDHPVILNKSERYYDRTVSIQNKDRRSERKEEFLGSGILEDGVLEEEGTVSLQNCKKVQGFLIRLSTREKVAVNKLVFRIGKSQNGMDYYIGDNAAISRNHAIIMQKNQHYYIIDTDSKNHIYINGKIIPTNQEIELSNYTNLKLANEEFLFCIEES